MVSQQGCAEAKLEQESLYRHLKLLGLVTFEIAVPEQSPLRCRTSSLTLHFLPNLSTFDSIRWHNELPCADATHTTPSRTDAVLSRPQAASSVTFTSRSCQLHQSAVTATSLFQVSRLSAQGSTLPSPRGQRQFSEHTVEPGAPTACEPGAF